MDRLTGGRTKTGKYRGAEKESEKKKNNSSNVPCNQSCLRINGADLCSIPEDLMSIINQTSSSDNITGAEPISAVKSRYFPLQAQGSTLGRLIQHPVVTSARSVPTESTSSQSFPNTLMYPVHFYVLYLLKVTLQEGE